MVIGKWNQKSENMKKKDLLQTAFADARKCLLINDTALCFNAYSIAVDSIINGTTRNGSTTIADEIMFLDKFQTLNPTLADLLKLYLNIVLFLIEDYTEKELSKNLLETYRLRKEPFKTPVMIFAGGASLMDKTKAETCRNFIKEMIRDFTGTIISGGTTVGIPGMIGELKAEIQSQTAVTFVLIGYLPKTFRTDVARSVAYDYFHETNSHHFSVLEVLSYWCDMVCSGINPSDVVLIGIEGGAISALEYRIALSFGAKVKILADSGRAASELLEDKFWNTHRNLIGLLPD